MVTMLRKEYRRKERGEDAVAWSGVAVLGLARGHCILTCSEGGAKSASWQIGCGI